MNFGWNLGWIATLSAIMVSQGRAASVTIGASKDAMMLANSSGVDSGNASGNGVELFAGADMNGGRKRSVLSFDIASAVPAGSTITGATLSLTLGQFASSGQGGTGANIPSRTFSLHENLQNWTEGSSGTSTPTTFNGAGNGYARRNGDVTWDYASYNSTAASATPWATSGGNFTPAASATSTFSTFTANTAYTFSSAGMAADVQSWLDSPSTNFGWLLKGDTGIDSGGNTVSLETTALSFLAFYSREGAGAVAGSSTNYAPMLSIAYTPEPASLSTLAAIGLLLRRRR